MHNNELRKVVSSTAWNQIFGMVPCMYMVLECLTLLCTARNIDMKMGFREMQMYTFYPSE